MLHISNISVTFLADHDSAATSQNASLVLEIGSESKKATCLFDGKSSYVFTDDIKYSFSGVYEESKILISIVNDGDELIGSHEGPLKTLLKGKTFPLFDKSEKSIATVSLDLNYIPQETISARMAEPPQTTITASTSSASQSSKLTEKYVELAASSNLVPAPVKAFLETHKDKIAQVADLVGKAEPYLELAWTKGQKLLKDLEPYRLELLLPSLVGLVMCFFGGSFLTLIAAVEAYRLCGYEKSLESLAKLRRALKALLAANKKDDSLDEDGNGQADVTQLSAKDLAVRKTLLFLRVVEPSLVSDALEGLTSGFLAVVATLKLEFAKAITLGAAIGSTLEPPLLKHFLPLLLSVLPKEYAHWAQPLISYAVKSVAISVAWFVQRVISAFHSAVRGGLLCSRNLLLYLSAMGILDIKEEDTNLDEIAGYVLAFLGLWFQLSRGFSLPFPLNILLFPFSILEYLLMWIVNK